MYFISKVLREAPSRYPDFQKLLYAVLIASKKLHRYFQAHKISVTMTFPLGSILRNYHSTGRIAKWAAELEFEIEFVPRNMIKSPVLADFIAEWTPGRYHLGRLPMPAGAPPRGYPPSFTGRAAPVHCLPHLPSLQQCRGVRRLGDGAYLGAQPW